MVAFTIHHLYERVYLAVFANKFFHPGIPPGFDHCIKDNLQFGASIRIFWVSNLDIYTCIHYVDICLKTCNSGLWIRLIAGIPSQKWIDYIPTVTGLRLAQGILALLYQRGLVASFGLFLLFGCSSRMILSKWWNPFCSGCVSMYWLRFFVFQIPTGCIVEGIILKSSTIMLRVFRVWKLSFHPSFKPTKTSHLS